MANIYFKNGDKFTSILDIVYPVGSVYITTDTTSPSEIVGGTWVKIEDKYIMGSSEEHPVNTSSDSGEVLVGEAVGINLGYQETRSKIANDGSGIYDVTAVDDNGNETDLNAKKGYNGQWGTDFMYEKPLFTFRQEVVSSESYPVTINSDSASTKEISLTKKMVNGKNLTVKRNGEVGTAFFNMGGAGQTNLVTPSGIGVNISGSLNEPTKLVWKNISPYYREVTFARHYRRLYATNLGITPQYFSVNIYYRTA